MTQTEINTRHRDDFQRLVNKAAQQAQWRGSEDGLRWTPWYQMTSPIMTVPCCLVYQVRVKIDGEWSLSPIGTTTHPSNECPRCRLRAHQLARL
jgi:hypothetical protein